MLDRSGLVLVTGGTGFAGRHLVAELRLAGFQNIAVTSFSSGSGSGSGTDSFWDGCKQFQLDLGDRAATEQLIAETKPAAVFHLAAVAAVGKSFEQASRLLQNNTQLQLNVLEAVRLHAPTARLLVVGSAEEYGMSTSPGELPITEDHPLRPINPYGVSKVTQDLLAYAYTQSYGLQIVRVRPFNHIGSHQTPEFAIASFAKQIVAIERGQQEKLLVGNLSGVRDFTNVADMARAYIMLLDRGVVGEVYNVGSGTGVAMEEVLEKLLELATVPIKVEQDASRLRPLDIPVITANNDKITALGWKPSVSLTESLQQVLEYWRSLT